MGGIEVFEREAATERAKVAGQRTTDDLAVLARIEAGRYESVEEAKSIREDLVRCRIVLQGRYDRATRSFKDRLYTVLLQIDNSIAEIDAVNPRTP